MARIASASSIRAGRTSIGGGRYPRPTRWGDGSAGDAGPAARCGGRLDRRFEDAELAGECLEARPRGHVLVLGEEHDLLVARRSTEQLEQGRLHRRVQVDEWIVQ